ncbi:MAG: response regulator [Deltaproteobacteria bacterium]|uniref:histidine kinase n=1 Tax=Candidatus Zymogenus saltonus TaxID=2844893 RepID=A0A9D8KHI9_9DELT|nr:response regulator [Candidatus Zymogenus saltonus]
MLRSEPIKILYVEDDNGLAHLVKDSLKREGYEVDIALNGEEGLAMYEAGSYDLIALDYEMPIFNGLEVMKKLSSEGDMPPTMMITGAGDENLAVEAMKLGAGDYLVKDIEGSYIDLIPIKVERILESHRLAIEKKRAEEELLRISKLLSEAQEVAKLGSWEWDIVNDNTVWSFEMYKILGVDISEPPSIEKMRELVHPDDKKICENLMKTVINGNRPEYIECRIITREGILKFVHFKAESHYDGSGKLIRMIGILQDITEQKRMEEHLIEGQKMKAVGALAAGVAHDFNNITATILGYASFLKNKFIDMGPVYEGLLAIQKSAIRASELTAQLLTYSRSREGKFEVVPVNINKVVDSVYNIITSEALEKSISINLEIESDLKNIEGDISQLTQVVMNLSMNALEAMTDGGTLTIQTYLIEVEKEIEMGLYSIKTGEYVCLKMKDTGIGMNRDTLNRVFDPYFTTKDEKSRIGLGLSVVYGIVKNHGGYINIDSETDRGTEITLYFPAESEKKEDTEKIDIKAMGGTESIMIIESEEAVLLILKNILTEAGYTVYAYDSGEAGLKAFREKEKPTDLVILDFIMPDIGGEEVLKKLLEIDPDIKVILSSGYSEVNQYRDVINLGAAGLVKKPFMANKLLREIREVLD